MHIFFFFLFWGLFFYIGIFHAKIELMDLSVSAAGSYINLTVPGIIIQSM